MAALPLLTRAQLNVIFRGDEAVIRAYEALQSGMQFVPDDIAKALEDSAQALLDAAAAQSSADAAQSTADAANTAASAAQANVDALEAIRFVTVGFDPLTPNARSIGPGQGVAITDGGAGNPVTIATSDLIAVLPANVSDVTGAFVNATGLSVLLPINATYIVDALITFQAAAVTTGVAFGFTLPAGATISGMYQHNTTATALEGSYNIASGAVKGNTTAVLVAAENVPAQGRWVIKTGGTAGTAQLQFRTEIAASAVTLTAGLSVLIARRVA
jgi:hypothetical protein